MGEGDPQHDPPLLPPTELVPIDQSFRPVRRTSGAVYLLLCAALTGVLWLNLAVEENIGLPRIAHLAVSAMLVLITVLLLQPALFFLLYPVRRITLDADGITLHSRYERIRLPWNNIEILDRLERLGRPIGIRSIDPEAVEIESCRIPPGGATWWWCVMVYTSLAVKAILTFRPALLAYVRHRDTREQMALNRQRTGCDLMLHRFMITRPTDKFVIAAHPFMLRYGTPPAHDPGAGDD